MFKKILVFSCLALFVISLNGCAGARKQQITEKEGLRNQISALEAQLQAKEEEIDSLRQELGAKEAALIQATKKAAMEIKERPNTKQIQAALQNAGFNPGPIDGKMGKQTREAIKAFQKANNLKVDGNVGKETWEVLRKYLYKRLK